LTNIEILLDMKYAIKSGSRTKDGIRIGRVYIDRLHHALY